MPSVRCDGVTLTDNPEERRVTLTDRHGSIHEFTVPLSELHGPDGLLLRVSEPISNEPMNERVLIEPPGRPQRGFWRIWIGHKDLIQ